MQVATGDRHKQSKLLLVSLLENFCSLYDKNPILNQRLFFAICQQYLHYRSCCSHYRLSAIGVIDSHDFLNDVTNIRSIYKKAFKEVLLRALDSIKDVKKITNSHTHKQVFPPESIENVFIMGNSRYQVGPITIYT